MLWPQETTQVRQHLTAVMCWTTSSQQVCSSAFAVQDLRQQMEGLHTQLQQVQLERSTLQSRLKTSQAEIDSLQQLRQWYQQQLALAQEARVRLQSEMASMQAWFMHFFFFVNQSLMFVIKRVDRIFFPLSGWTDDSDWCS